MLIYRFDMLSGHATFVIPAVMRPRGALEEWVRYFLPEQLPYAPVLLAGTLKLRIPRSALSRFTGPEKERILLLRADNTLRNQTSALLDGRFELNPSPRNLVGACAPVRALALPFRVQGHESNVFRVVKYFVLDLSDRSAEVMLVAYLERGRGAPIPGMPIGGSFSTLATVGGCPCSGCAGPGKYPLPLPLSLLSGD